MPVPLFPLDAWLDNVALGALSSRETVRASYDIACAAIAAGVPGDFVECGVFGGAQCAAMARALHLSHDYGWSHARHVHLFDTFTGIPQAGPHDAEFQEAQHAAGLSACSLEAVKDHMKEWSIPSELFEYYAGPFEERIPPIAKHERYIEEYGDLAGVKRFPSGIAVLRLDADLYESTRVCMEHLYPLVSPGGWVIVDDWGLSGARKAVEEAVKPGPIYFQVHKGAK